MIKLKDVTKYYTSDTSVTMALQNINLEFCKGEFVAITGKSGSGKSTLLNILSGMDTYEDGEMYFKGMETSYYDSEDWENYRRENISFIYQSYNLIDSYTALENVESVMMICGDKESSRQQKERRRRALEILDKVGLRKWAGHKAVHLSSGQKQRLGIARALAKDTDIIIADEPTGNLDVENGAAVMKMLYELSKDRLVIVVTHNFEQVQEYATRKIRLFDGKVAEDLKLKPEQYGNGRCSEKEEETAGDKGKSENTLKTAIRFVGMNRKAQPHRTFFIFSILTVTIAAFFIMFGYFLSNLDDSKTRTISEDIFNNTSDNRLIVRKADGSVLSDDDFSAIEALQYVSYVEKYDYANEISCLYQKDIDYTVEYKKTENSERKSVTVRGKDYSHFVKSILALKDGTLTEGTLPQAANEVVLPAGNESLIGTQTEIYFHSKDWSDSTYLGGTFTVTGTAESEDESPYFSEDFVRTLNINYADSAVEMRYNIIKTSVYDDASQEDVVENSDKKGKVILVEGDGLSGNQIRISSAITLNIQTEGKKVVGKTAYESLDRNAVLVDETDSKNENSYEVEILEDTHDGSSNVVECSRELLEQIYGTSEIVQASVYIDDYAYTDRVIKKITAAGFQVVSPYRVSAGDYDDTLIQQQIYALLMAAGALVVIFVLAVMVIYSMMKLKRKDFIILKSLGLRQKTICEMNYYELVMGGLWSVLLLWLVMVFAGKYQIDTISDVVKYYSIGNYLLIAALSIAMTIITAWLFNRHLAKKMN